MQFCGVTWSRPFGQCLLSALIVVCIGGGDVALREIKVPAMQASLGR
jgi:hypothetical protein